MMTIFEKDGWIRWCGKDEKTGEMPTKEFFEGGFLGVIDEGTIFVDDFQNLSMCLIEGLLSSNFTDATKTDLENPGSLGSREFKYILSDDNLSFYSITYRHGTKSHTFYEYKNLVAASISDIMKDFGGTEVVAMYRAGIQVRSFAERSNTISSCAYSHWKKGYGKASFEASFHECGEKAEKICRDAYHGGLCMVQDGVANKHIGPGIVLDANSLYPYIMKTNRFAVGEEHYGVGDVPEEIKNASKYTYFIRFKASFELKEKHIPFVRTRCDKHHWQLEILKTSAYFDADGNRYDFYKDPNVTSVDEWGEIHEGMAPFLVEMCMYKDEYELFLEHYDIFYLEPIEYVYFRTRPGIFEDYINEFYEMKKNAKGKAERRIGKIFQNALSGRMSLKKKRRNAYLCENAQNLIEAFGTNDYKNRATYHGKFTDGYVSEGISPMIGGDVETTSKSMSHIQIGAAITSMAMVFIVRKAQENYDHFLYTDTDSLHLDCGLEDVVGCEIGPELGQFKVEHTFSGALYRQQKVYTLDECEWKYEDGEKTLIQKPVSVTWAGLPEDSQKILSAVLTKSLFKRLYPGSLLIDELDELIDLSRPKHISDADWNFFMTRLFNMTHHIVDDTPHTNDDWEMEKAYNKKKEQLDKDRKSHKITEMKYRQICSKMYKARKEHYAQKEFKTLCKLPIPHVRKVVKSYKNFEFEWKTEWHSIDMTGDL